MPTSARRRPSTSIAANPSERRTGRADHRRPAELVPRGEFVGDPPHLGHGVDHVMLMRFFQPRDHCRRRAGGVDHRAQKERMPRQPILDRGQGRGVGRGGPDGSRHRHRVVFQVDVLDRPAWRRSEPGCEPSWAGGRVPSGRRRSTRARASRPATRRAARPRFDPARPRPPARKPAPGPPAMSSAGSS